MAITKGTAELVRQAKQHIVNLNVEDAAGKLSDENVQFVDLRDIRELWRDGTIPGAIHVPRGMIEFWVDPDSPYHKPVFASGKNFVLFCASGWRSALATKAVVDMGLENVAHIEGGYTAWQAAGHPVEPVPRK